MKDREKETPSEETEALRLLMSWARNKEITSSRAPVWLEHAEAMAWMAGYSKAFSEVKEMISLTLCQKEPLKTSEDL